MSRFNPSNTSTMEPAQIDVGPVRDYPYFQFDLLGFSVGYDSSESECVFEVTGPVEWH